MNEKTPSEENRPDVSKTMPNSRPGAGSGATPPGLKDDLISNLCGNDAGEDAFENGDSKAEDADKRQKEPAFPKTSFPEPPQWEFKRPILKDHPSKKKSDQNGYKSLGVGLAVGYALVGSIIGGWIIGYWLDKSFGTSFWQGVGLLVGLPIGLVGALIILSRSGK